jgi:glycerol-3-phosphate acyltransferase PlsX
MIAVDVMSGERSPEVIIKGALKAAQDFDVELALVGDEEHIHNCLRKFRAEESKARVFHAPDIIGMHELPAQACKKKKDASVMVGTRLIGEGKAEGFFSPGNTGATLVASLMNIGRVEGILRPGLITYIPTVKGWSLLVDAGANLDCTPEYLAQFAVMGEVFAREFQEKDNPTVGLLSVGVEKTKGNESVLKTHELLRKLRFNFVGNIEGYDIFDGDVDVIVCDGFVGNVVLKVTERVFKLTFELVGQEIENHLMQRVGYSFVYPAVKNLRKKTDPSEYGGAYLIGLNGIVVIGHGSSDAVTTYNGVRLVNNGIKVHINDLIVKRLEEFGLLKRREPPGR